MRLKLFLFSCLVWFAGCAPHRQETASVEIASQSQSQTKVETLKLDLVDLARNRSVPVLLYSPASGEKTKKVSGKLAILNHGYGGTNAAYSFIANYLVAHGYVSLVFSMKYPVMRPSLPLVTCMKHVCRTGSVVFRT